ncbi:MAG: DUF115 domain-containing protein [Desulfovibrionaceae bacterium]|nr:DUF115 domain-containing protein [Desulfovibrionaceae bacterium]
MENSKIAALVELGILCRGEPVKTPGDGVADPGPHVCSGHNQLCRYENPKFQHPFEDGSVEAFTFFSPEVTIEEALSRTRLVAVLGAADTDWLNACMDRPDAVVILFEPDERVLVKFLEAAGLARLNRKNFFCFTGDPCSFNPALQDIFPGDLFRRGTPFFIVTKRITEDYGPWAAQVMEYLEVLHYRNVIYPLSGQALARSLPLRKICRGMLYDQQRHAYENVMDCLTSPPIAELRNTFRGMPAILVAAGPDLPGKFDYIRANRDRAVVICVNNAVKPLAEAGIQPHFVIINDTSVDSGRVFEHIPDMAETILVAHCLSALGGNTFRRKFLFGEFVPEVFGSREMLRLHGSVISTAFSLAVHLGCGKCILVGAQLASDNPWGLVYARGTTKAGPIEEERPLTNAFPQLYPMTSPFGERLYTTLNFRDAALWLAEVVRLSGVECVNTSRSSILYGRGIDFEAEPVLPEASLARAFSRLFRLPPPRVDREMVRRYLNHERRLWQSIGDAARTMTAENGPAMAAKGMAILKQLDGNNVTYLLERRRGFNNRRFCRLVFEGGEKGRRQGFVYYFQNLLDMSEEFLALLDTASRRL